jgi:exodeoxyribonuclease V alpha subunit
LNEITLAFAMTIHKAQGSEYSVVILPVFMQHYMMLSQNLIYTGLTQARKLPIVVGSQKARCFADTARVGLSVKQVKDQERCTLLNHWLSRG